MIYQGGGQNKIERKRKRSAGESSLINPTPSPCTPLIVGEGVHCFVLLIGFTLHALTFMLPQ